MDKDTIILLIKWLPTIVVGLYVLINLFRGLIRGFRKSLILFIHYLIAMAVGFALFFVLRDKFYTHDFNSVWVQLDGYVSVSLSSCKTVFDVAEVFIQSLAAGMEKSLEDPYVQQMVIAIAGLVVNFVLAFICLVVIPFLVRVILRLFYALFYSEAKKKRRLEDEDEEYHRHAFLGMFVGILRGAVTGTLAVSLISSLYFIVGTDTTAVSSASSDSMVTTLDQYLSEYGITTAELISAVGESRGNGVGVVYSKVNVNGAPIDYFFADQFVSSTFKSYKDQKTTVTLNLREELGLLFNLAEVVMSSDAIKVTNVDGTYVVNYNYEELVTEISTTVSNYVTSSKLTTEVVPLAIIGASQAVADGNVTVPDGIKDYFTPELIQELKTIDYETDLGNIIKAACQLIEVAPITAEGQLDNAKIADIKYWLCDDDTLTDAKKAEFVTAMKKVFTSFSEIDLVTKAVFPIGLMVTLNSKSEELKAQGIDTDDVDFTTVDFEEEVANLGNVYEKVVALDLDYDLLLGSGSEEITTTADDGGTTPETTTDPRLEYIMTLCDDAAFKTKLLDLTDTVFGTDSTSGSKLLRMCGMVALKYAINNATIKNDDGTENTELNAVMQVLKDNFATYTESDLQKDVHTLVDSCLSALSIYTVFSSSSGSSVINLLSGIPVENLEVALLGKDDGAGNTSGGLYDLHLLQYKNSEDKPVIDLFLSTLLKQKASSFFSEESIDSITNWKEEFKSLCNTVKVLQEVIDTNPTFKDLTFDENILSNFPDIADSDVDKFTEALSDSKLITSALESMLSNALSSSTFASYCDVNVISASEWKDTKVAGVYQHGEINALMKAAVFVTSSGLDLTDTAKMTESLSTSDGEIADVLTKSKLMTIALEKIIKECLEQAITGVVIPSDLVYVTDTTDWATYSAAWNTELHALIGAISISAFKNDSDSFDTTKLTSMDCIQNLSDTDIDKLTGSQIIAINLSLVVDQALSGTGFNIPTDLKYVEGTTVWATYSAAWNEELHSIVGALGIDAFKTSGSFDTAKLTSIDSFQSLTTTDVGNLTSSRIIATNLPSVVSDALSGVGFTIPSDLDYVEGTTDWTTYSAAWNTELNSIVAVLGIDAFKTAGSFDSAKLTSMESFQSLTTTDVNNLTSSKIIATNLPSAVSDALNSVGFNVPSEFEYVDGTTDWTTYSAAWNNELNAIVEVLGIDAFKTAGSFDTSKLTKMDSFQDLDSSDVDKITASKIIATNLPSVIGDALSGVNFTVPSELGYTDGTTAWASYSSDWNTELKALVAVLDIDSFKTAGAFDSAKLTSIDSFQSLTDTDIDKLTASKIIETNLSGAVEDALDGSGFDIDTSLVTSWNEELKRVVAILNYEEVQDASGKADISLLKQPDNLAQLIFENLDHSLNYSKVENITKSAVFTKIIADEIANFSGSGITIVTPVALKKSDTNTTYYINWQHDASDDYTNGELGNLVYIFYAARKAVIADGATKLDYDNLINGILGMSEHSAIVESGVIYATVSQYLLDAKADGKLLIRDAAIDNTKEIKIKEEEIVKALDVLSALDINDIDNIKVGAVLLKLNNDTIRANIASSNILNITCVDKILTSAGDKLDVPVAYGEKTADGWYSTTLANSELYRMLTAIAALELTTDSSDNLVMDKDVLVNKLSDSGIVNDVYNSEVFATTISKYLANYLTIVDTYKANSTASAVNVVEKTVTTTTSATIKVVTKDEMMALSSAMAALGINASQADSVTANMLLKLPAASINQVVSSYLIANKLSEVILGSSAISKVESTIFTVNTTEYIYRDELAKFAIAVGANGIGITDTQAISFANIDCKKDDNTFDNTKFNNAVDSSIILRATISDKLDDSVNPTYDATGAEMRVDGYIKSDEITALVDVLYALYGTGGVDFDSLSASGIASLNINTVYNAKEKMATSSIIKYMVTKNLVDQATSGRKVLTKTYYSNQTSEYDVVNTYGTDSYIISAELISTITAAKYLDLSVGDLGSTSTSAYITKVVSAYSTYGAANVKTAITSSAIVSNIFSEVFDTNTGYFSYAQLCGQATHASATYYTARRKTANALKDNSSINIYSQDDVGEMVDYIVSLA